MKSLSEGIDATRQTIDRLTAGMGDKALRKPENATVKHADNLTICRTLIAMTAIGAALTLMLTGIDGWGWMLFVAVLVSPGRKPVRVTWQLVSRDVKGSKQPISG